MNTLIPENLEKNAMSLLLAVMGALMIAAAVLRHLLPEYENIPLAAAGGCLTWIASLGMARAAALGIHVRMGFVENTASDNTRRRLALIADAAFLLFAAATLAIGCAVLAASRGHPDAAKSLPVYLALPAGSALTILRLAKRIRAASGEPRA